MEKAYLTGVVITSTILFFTILLGVSLEVEDRKEKIKVSLKKFFEKKFFESKKQEG